jgi:acyl transferase domain-containing protein
VGDVTAFVFPGLDGAGQPAEHAWALALPGFRERWAAVVAWCGREAGFVDFEQALLEGHTLPAGPTAWRWRALAVMAMQLAAADALERRGECAQWLCGYSLGDLARSCHAGVATFAQFVAFAASLPPLPCVRGSTIAAVLADGARTAALRANLRRAGIAACRLSPRFLLVAGDDATRERAHALATAAGARVRPVGDCPLHAPVLRGLARILAEAARTARVLPAARAMFSTLWGRAVVATDDLLGEFTTNVAAPIDFARAVQRLRVRHGVTRFVDLGPGRHASAFVRHHDAGVQTVHCRELLAG